MFRAVSLAPMEMLPCSRLLASWSEASAAWIWEMADSTWRYNSSPSGVSRTPRLVRMNRVLCTCSSRQFMARVTLGCPLPRALAALVKFPYLAT